MDADQRLLTAGLPTHPLGDIFKDFKEIPMVSIPTFPIAPNAEAAFIRETAIIEEGLDDDDLTDDEYMDDNSKMLSGYEQPVVSMGSGSMACSFLKRKADSTFHGDALVISSRKHKRQSKGNFKRSERRDKERLEKGRKPYKNVALNYVQKTNQSIVATFDASKGRVATGAYTARPLKDKVQKVTMSLEDITNAGVEVIKWDGRLPLPIIDETGKVWAVAAGRPTDKGFEDVVNDCTRLFAEASLNDFGTKVKNTRRGPQASVNRGFSMGMGQREPTPTKINRNAHVIDDMVLSDCFKRVASYGDFALHTWAPDLYSLYHATMKATLDHLPKLKEHRNFSKSVFPSCTFNMEGAVTYKHTDPMNCPADLCAVTAFGNFDYRQGGHLILWDAMIAIEFPAGSTILIPSAIIAHSNVAIREGEKRYSFTQFFSGSIMRWVDAGFRLDSEIKKNCFREYQRMMKSREGRHRKKGFNYFSTIDDLGLCFQT